jgi:hypothetical protein
MAKKYFEIDENNWQDAVDKGWNIVKVESKNMQFGGERYGTEETKIFVEEELPGMFEDLYQSISDKLIESGMDEGSAIETMEEMVALELAELLTRLGGYFNSNLVRGID